MPFDEEELDPHGECRHEIERLRKALLPFACEADAFEECDDSIRLRAMDEDGEIVDIPVTVGHLRAAKAALNN